MNPASEDRSKKKHRAPGFDLRNHAFVDAAVVKHDVHDTVELSRRSAG